jgi:hypothetical protein
MDHEFPGVRGEMSPSEAVAWSEAFDRVPDRLRGAFVAWLKHADVGYPDRKLVDRFESAYRGEYDSLDDYAMTFLEECLPDFKAPDGYRIVPDDSWEQSHTYADGYVFSDDDN